MLPVVTLLRDYRGSCTLGTIILPSGRVLKSIEPPWLDNRSSVSCYPEGTYIAKWMDRSSSGKYKRVWHIQDVPGRVGILCHNGNLVRHTKGCTLVGLTHGTLGGLPAVLSSRSGMSAIRRELEERDFIIVVGKLPKINED